MSSGYNQRLEDEYELGLFQAWTNYVTLVSINGGSPVGYKEWKTPQGDSTSSDQSEDSAANKRSKSKELRSARKISAKKKAAFEAAMNAIP